MEKMTKNRIAETQDNRFNSSEITIAQLNSVINWTFAALWPLTKNFARKLSRIFFSSLFFNFPSHQIVILLICNLTLITGSSKYYDLDDHLDKRSVSDPMNSSYVSGTSF